MNGQIEENLSIRINDERQIQNLSTSIRKEENNHSDLNLDNHFKKINISNGSIRFFHHENNYMHKASDIELIWKDIEIYIENKHKRKFKHSKNSKDKDNLIINRNVILNKVSGRVKSGECLAIIGASGAGKTTLLNYLSMKISSSILKVKGEYLINSEHVNAHLFELLSAYVMQEDILDENLTPLETFIFAAKMKLNLSTLEIEERVFKMINDLHLNKCQHTRIGSVLKRGISGGERKRTSIGVELISDPQIIFMDEPTTGLDSYNAYEVINLLRKLASDGKMIIFTIHQPSSEIFNLLDKLCILGLGKTIYFGDQNKSFDFFESVNLSVPLLYNPFEYFIEITNIVTIEYEKVLNLFPQLKEIEDKQKRYEAYVDLLADKFNEDINLYVETTPPLSKLTDENKLVIKSKTKRASIWYEIAMLFGRHTVINRRNPNILFLKMTQSIFVAVLVAIVYMNISKDYSGIRDRNGLILITIVSSILSTVTGALLVLPDERRVFTRERANRMYRPSSYFISRSIAELPVFFISCTLFGLIVYPSLSLNDTYSFKYYSFIGVSIMGSFVGISWAFFLACLIPDKITLININSALTILLLLLSGFYAKPENYAPYLIPLEYISIFKYAYQALTHIIFADDQPLYCFNYPNQICRPLAMFVFREPFYVNFIALAALYVSFKIIAFICLYFFAKIKI